MTVREKLTKEVEALAQAGLYFGVWLATLVVIKKLVLEEYQIEFHGLSLALMGTLVLSKVVVIFESVPFKAWNRTAPVWVEVVLRTGLYSVGVAVVLLLEKAFDGRHEYGGLVASLRSLFHHADINHVWVNTICLGGALLGFNVLWAVRRHLGEGGLLRLFLEPWPNEPVAKGSSTME